MVLMGLVRKHVERLYVGTCDVWEYVQTVDSSGISCFEEVLKQQSIPCRVSYGAIQSAGDGKAASVSQDILLFLSPDIAVKPGSKVSLTQNGNTAVYQNSGEATIYETHQEISLTHFERWA